MSNGQNRSENVESNNSEGMSTINNIGNVNNNRANYFGNLGQLQVQTQAPSLKPNLSNSLFQSNFNDVSNYLIKEGENNSKYEKKISQSEPSKDGKLNKAIEELNPNEQKQNSNQNNNEENRKIIKTDIQKEDSHEINKSHKTSGEYIFVDPENLNKLGKKIYDLIDSVGSLAEKIDSSNTNQEKLLQEIKTSNQNHDKLLEEIKTSNQKFFEQMQASNQTQVNFLDFLTKKFFPEEKETFLSKEKKSKREQIKLILE